MEFDRADACPVGALKRARELEGVEVPLRWAARIEVVDGLGGVGDEDPPVGERVGIAEAAPGGAPGRGHGVVAGLGEERELRGQESGRRAAEGGVGPEGDAVDGVVRLDVHAEAVVHEHQGAGSPPPEGVSDEADLEALGELARVDVERVAGAIAALDVVVEAPRHHPEDGAVVDRAPRLVADVTHAGEHDLAGRSHRGVAVLGAGEGHLPRAAGATRQDAPDVVRRGPQGIGGLDGVDGAAVGGLRQRAVQDEARADDARGISLVAQDVPPGAREGTVDEGEA